VDGAAALAPPPLPLLLEFAERADEPASDPVDAPV
jgi:hypothetical protein